MDESFTLSEECSASLVMSPSVREGMGIMGVFTVECRNAKGELLWEDVIHNLVTTLGKNLTLNATLDNAAAGAVVMGLKGTGSAVVGDTQASHAGWNEVGGANLPTYSGTRKTPTWSAASGSSKATSAVVAFTFTGTGTVAGCFINIAGSSTIDNTTGTLFSAGDFSGGSRSVVSTDVINVTYTLTIT
jgi:hypothetical protein